MDDPVVQAALIGAAVAAGAQLVMRGLDAWRERGREAKAAKASRLAAAEQLAGEMGASLAAVATAMSAYRLGLLTRSSLARGDTVFGLSRPVHDALAELQAVAFRLRATAPPEFDEDLRRFWDKAEPMTALFGTIGEGDVDDEEWTEAHGEWVSAFRDLASDIRRRVYGD